MPQFVSHYAAEAATDHGQPVHEGERRIGRSNCGRPSRAADRIEDTWIMFAGRPSAAKLIRPRASLADGSVLPDAGGVRSACERRVDGASAR